MKQTAVEWLVENIQTLINNGYEFHPKFEEKLIEQAKEMEKEQQCYSEEDLKDAYFSAVESTGEGWNGEYADGNNPNVRETFDEGFEEWFEQFKKK